MARAVVTLPAQARRGEIIEIKTLAAHPMETGFRRTQLGELIPRDIIRRFVCTYNGAEVFRVDLHPAVAANPLIAFTTERLCRDRDRLDPRRVSICTRPCLVLAAACVFLDLRAAGAAAEIPPAERRSGYEFMGRETRAMQDDDATNPGLLWVLDGEINACRTGRQKAAPLAFESRDLLALTAYVARQSRGLPIDIAIDEPTRPFLQAGRETFYRRQGQLNLACAQCHDDHWGAKLAGSPITQAHPTGYPLYRLEWQGLGSLERRLRSCLAGMRAEPYAYGAPEFVDLELYLMWRARGMKIETPAVRP